MENQIRWMPVEIYKMQQELAKKKEAEMFNFMRTGFKNEEDNENYFALKELTDKVWKLLEGKDFTNEEIQNTFTYELHKIIGNLYKIQKYKQIDIDDNYVRFEKEIK